MKNFVITTALLAMLGSATLAHPGHPHKKPTTPVKKTVLICPVTRDKIASTKAAVGHTLYKGKTYYFCCAMCKPRFDKDPAKYVRNAAKGKFEKGVFHLGW